MMSTEPLSFGPEWLRNRSQEGCSQSSITIPRYQLAEYRYGREEMLALSGRLNPPPDSIKSIPSLYVEKAQVPLALIQMTEEETRQWNRGINSDAVLRLAGKAPVGGPPASIRGGGRGGSVDRGRGRGRGSYYTRGLSFEEGGEVGELRGGSRPERGDGPSLSASSFPRNIRPFDRSQSAISTERGWSERNGTDSGDWNGGHSPRKEFGTGRSFMNDNWRRHRTGTEDEDGWRTATGGRTEKWTRSSWREGEKEGGDVDRGGRSQQWEQRTRGGWDDGHHLQRRPWDEDNLPEWATENPSESGGSFDATGAFHGGGFSDEDEINGGTGSIRRDPRTRKMSEGSGSTNIQKRQVSSSKKMSVDLETDGRKRLGEELNRQVQNQNVERLGSEATTPSTSSSERDLPVSKPPPSSLGGSSVSDTPQVHGHDRTNASSVDQSGVNAAPSSNTALSSNFVKSSGVDLRAESGSVLCEPHVPREAAKVCVPKQTVVSTAQSTMPTLPYQGFPPAKSTTVNSPKPEEAWDQMPEDADHLVEKLMAEDDQQEKLKLSQKPSSTEATQPPPPHQRTQERWYYRDPQGQEQGPFFSSDMAEWYKCGYFKPTLLIRRSCDEHFSRLGDLIESWGMVPFLAPPHFKPSEPITANLSTTQTSKSVPTLPSPIDPESVMLEQYHFQMLQRQLMLSQQAAIQAAVHKLSQNDRWNTLSPLEQQQLITQQVMSQPLDPYMNMLPGGLDQKNSISQLLTQLQQSKISSPPLVENKLPPPPMAPVPPQMPPLDPLQQMIQQMGGLQQPATSPILPQAMPIPTVPMPPPPVTLGLPTMMHPAQTLPEDPAAKLPPDPIQMLLRQLNASKPQVESLWSGNAHPLFGNNLSWMPRISPPPGQMPTSIWDIHGKEIKTEQEIMEEQRRAAEERRLEELRKQEEERKRKEEEEQARLKLEEELRKEVERRKEEQRKRAEEEKRQQEKEAKRREEERKKQEEEKKRLQEEERKRKEEVKRLEEEARKQKEEAVRRKEEEKKRKEEEKEKKRKLEEERRKLEELQKKEEEEKKRQEEEEAARKKAEEEQVRQQRRQAEALRRLQEQQQQQQRAKAAAWSQPVAPQPSLAEIQRQERDKKEREAKEMQQMLAAQQSAAAAAAAAATAAAAAAALQQTASDKNSLHLNWVSSKPTVNKVKSLAEIQAEEQKIAKNQERERAERAQQQKDIQLPAMSSIWGSASQSLTWTQNNTVWSNISSGSTGSTSGNGGFWDDISLNVAKPATPVPKIVAAKPVKATVPTNKNPASGNKAKGSKKDEAVVMKLFEQNVQRTDDFTQWCTKTLTELHASCVEIPTFVAFLRDIESPYEVKDYIRTYLGESKEIIEFSRQFLERRSKWRSMQRAVQEEDDMCTPAPAINPLSSDFTEVKGKGKKTKKNKMFRVDNRILGFNVTAAEDRFNVGDRHYVEEL